ncbi:MAG: TolC family protein [Desulfobacterales bacterium]|nr:TolC family protein [Desulfobacterales bacterium]
MKNNIFVIILLGIQTTLWGCSGHKAVVKELSGYKPPAIYDSANLLSKNQKPTEISQDDKAFEAQKAKLQKIKKDWESLLSNLTKEKSFHAPDIKSLSDRFSLKDLEIQVIERNAMIKNAEKNFRATLEAYNQASILDDIQRSFSAFNAQIMTGVGNMEDMESIYRKFPFPGILALKGDIVNQEIKIALTDLEIAKRTAITEARKNYWNLIYNSKGKEITIQTLNLLKELESSAVKRYETGQSQISELTKVKIQREKMKEELTNIIEEGLNIEKRLKSLLLLPSSFKIGTPVKIEVDKSIPSIDILFETALKKRQELEKIRIMITRMELMIEMAETEIYPGFTLNLALTENRGVTQAGTIKMEEPFSVTTTSSMGSGLPKMPLTGLLDAYIIETRQRLYALREELKAYESETESKVRDAWSDFDQAKRELSLYNNRIKELSRLNSKVSTKAYESGSIPFSENIDSVMLNLETKLSIERRKADLGISLADLFDIIGISEGF